MPGSFHVKIKGDREVNRLLKEVGLPDSVKEQIVRHGTDRIAQVARPRAPGSLGSGIRGKTYRRGGKFWGEVVVSPARRAGRDRKRGGRFRAEWALDASRSPRYRNSATGRLTKSWFRGAKRGALREMRLMIEAELVRRVGVR